MTSAQAYSEQSNGLSKETNGLWLHKGPLTVRGPGLSDPPNHTYVLTLGGVMGGGAPSRIDVGTWVDSHIRIDQQYPAEPRIGFHESGHSALCLYKPSGQHALRIRTNDGRDFPVAGPPGTIQNLIGQYVAGVSYQLPSTNVWHETPMQVSPTCSGVACRIEWSVAGIGSANPNGAINIGLGVDGTLLWNLWRVNTGYVNQQIAASGIMYYTPTAGVRRFAVFLNATGPCGFDPSAISTLFITEQRA